METHRQQSDLISLLLFLKNVEFRLMKIKIRTCANVLRVLFHHKRVSDLFCVTLETKSIVAWRKTVGRWITSDRYVWSQNPVSRKWTLSADVCFERDDDVDRSCLNEWKWPDDWFVYSWCVWYTSLCRHTHDSRPRDLIKETWELVPKSESYNLWLGSSSQYLLGIIYYVKIKYYVWDSCLCVPSSTPWYSSAANST
jgi:hypothetical protein